MSENRQCDNCLFCATHENCVDCLGTPAEVKARESQGFTGHKVFLYRHWVAGDGIARIRRFEREGTRNIVIGNAGEAEVNIKDSPEETLTRLCDVAEACGYLVHKGEWNKAVKEIHVHSHGFFVLRYTSQRLRIISEIHQRVIWDAATGVEGFIPAEEEG